MRIILKIAFGLLGLLLVSGVALAVFLPLYFDPNDYKAEIAQKVKEQTGRELTLKGDISLSVFPWLGMEIADASLSNAPGFGREPFAAVRRAEARVKLLPLLRKEIEIGTVVLDGLVLRLQKNAVGQNNWDDIGPQEKPDEPKPAKDKPSEFKVESLEVAALEVRDSSVLWSDVQKGSHYQLHKFNFRTGRLRSAEPFLLKSDFELVTGKPAVTRQVRLEGKVNADVKKKSYRIEKFRLDAAMAGGKQPIRLVGSVDLDLQQQKLAISDLVLEAFTLKAVGQVAGSRILDQPVFTGRIKADDINPRAVMQALGKDEPDTADGSVLKNASFESDFSATAERADLRPIRLRLDDSNMNGSLSIANYSKPAIGFDLKVDEIDMDRYLAPPEKDKGGGSAGAGGKDGGGVSAIKDLNLSGTLNVGKLKIKNLRMDNAVLSLRAKDGIMVIEPFTANFYQGRINLAGRVDARGARPSYAINAQTSNIAVEPMLIALNGSSKISGTGSLNLELNTSGSTTEEIKRTSNGTLSFNLRDGEFKGVNLTQKLRQAYATYKGERYVSNEPQTTRFSQIQGTARIHNGVLQNDDLDARSTAFGADGSGSANLVAETINYLVKVTVAEAAAGELGKGLEELVGATIPVRLTGSLYAPEWKVDIAAVLEGRLREEVKKRTDEATDKARQKLQDKLMDKLGGGRSAAEPTAPATAEPSSSTAPSAEPSAAQSEAERKAAKKAAKEAAKQEAIRKLLGQPSEPPPEPTPAPAE
jgi:AsmA protein